VVAARLRCRVYESPLVRARQSTIALASSGLRRLAHGGRRKRALRTSRLSVRRDPHLPRPCARGNATKPTPGIDIIGSASVGCSTIRASRQCSRRTLVGSNRITSACRRLSQAGAITAIRPKSSQSQSIHPRSRPASRKRDSSSRRDCESRSSAAPERSRCRDLNVS
jgi:hypothetical protein